MVELLSANPIYSVFPIKAFISVRAKKSTGPIFFLFKEIMMATIVK
jgi:hypothetical protein